MQYIYLYKYSNFIKIPVLLTTAARMHAYLRNLEQRNWWQSQKPPIG